MLSSIADRFKGAGKSFKEAIEAWAKPKILSKIEVVVDKLPGLIKNQLEDHEMPRCAARGKDRAIDVMWPEFKEEIMWEVACLLDGEPNHAAHPDEPGPCCFFRFFRYHLYPNDKSFWGRLRDPVFCFFTLLSMVPVSGLAPLLFLFFFLIIDKHDEYQCIAYILQFKGFQFLSHGVIRSIMGFFNYIGCVSAVADDSGRHSCVDNGPGMAGVYQLVVGGFFMQVVLCWISYLFLVCCSKEKGRSKLSGKVAHEHATSTAHSKGGLIKYLLMYDLFCFIVVFGSLFYIIQTRPEGVADAYDDWVMKQSVFACQVVYGYLSLPFFFFALPFLQNVLLHVVPTGYDKKGRTRGFKWPDSVEEQRKQKAEEERKLTGGFLSMEDTNGMLDSLKGMFLSQSDDGEPSPKSQAGTGSQSPMKLPGQVA